MCTSSPLWPILKGVKRCPTGFTFCWIHYANDDVTMMMYHVILFDEDMIFIAMPPRSNEGLACDMPHNLNPFKLCDDLNFLFSSSCFSMKSKPASYKWRLSKDFHSYTLTSKCNGIEEIKVENSSSDYSPVLHTVESTLYCIQVVWCCWAICGLSLR